MKTKFFFGLLILLVVTTIPSCRKSPSDSGVNVKSYTKKIAGKRRWIVTEHYKCWYCNPQVDRISNSTTDLELFVLNDSTVLDDSNFYPLYFKLTDASQDGLLIYGDPNFKVLKYYYKVDSLIYKWSTIGPGESRETTYTSKR